jgi:hypothetical protein
MANVTTVVVKVTGHTNALRRVLVATEVGSLREAARSERLKRQSPISRKGLMRMKREKARQRRRRTSSLTGLSKQGLTGGQTWIKRT